jgi:hypothetical protein
VAIFIAGSEAYDVPYGGRQSCRPCCSFIEEEATMTADMMIYVHPELDAKNRLDLERNLSGRIGVDCAAFERRDHPHSLMVKYDPDAIRGMDILQAVRGVDPAAAIMDT